MSVSIRWCKVHNRPGGVFWCSHKDAGLSGLDYCRMVEGILVDLDHLRALVTAVTNEGPHPEYHREVMRRHRKEWPTLWKALDALFAAQEEAHDGTG